MRCLGRLVALIVLVILAAVAWLYRDELHRWVDHQLHPAAAVLRIGHASSAGYSAAEAKLAALQHARQDSVVLTADEATSLLARGINFLPGSTFDSLSIELGDRTVRVRTLVDSARIPAAVRRLIPGHLSPYQEVIVRGTLAPVHAGLAEFDVEHVSLHGIPLPSDVVARLAAQASGRGGGGRFEIVLPPSIDGFRVRPEGMVIYRQGGSR